MKVEVFSAGDHFHVDPKGASDLIEMLLKRAGYKNDITWKVRIDKMLHCSPETPPVKIIGFKEFGVYMRIKPRPNATINHQMTLLLPDGAGYTAESIFTQLVIYQKSISRRWREEFRAKPKPSVPVIRMPELSPVSTIPDTTIPDTPLQKEETLVMTVIEPTEKELNLNFTNLKAIVQNKHKLRYVLRRIHHINNNKISTKKEEFIEWLRADCKWEHHLLRIVSRTMTELLKLGYISEATDDRNKITGYSLAPRGIAILSGKPDPGEPQVLVKTENIPSKKVERPDLGILLRQFTTKAQEIADIGRKLDIIESKRDVLRKELDLLNKEYEKYSSLISKDKVWTAIKELNSFYEETPVKESV